MERISPNDAVIENLQIGGFLAYLEERGWQKVEHPNAHALVFQSSYVDDDGRPIILLLPENLDLQDARLRLAEAVNTLAFLQKESPQTIMERINPGNVVSQKITVMAESPNHSGVETATWETFVPASLLTLLLTAAFVVPSLIESLSIIAKIFVGLIWGLTTVVLFHSLFSKLIIRKSR